MTTNTFVADEVELPNPFFPRATTIAPAPDPAVNEIGLLNTPFPRATDNFTSIPLSPTISPTGWWNVDINTPSTVHKKTVSFPIDEQVTYMVTVRTEDLVEKLNILADSKEDPAFMDGVSAAISVCMEAIEDLRTRASKDLATKLQEVDNRERALDEKSRELTRRCNELDSLEKELSERFASSSSPATYPDYVRDPKRFVEHLVSDEVRSIIREYSITSSPAFKVQALHAKLSRALTQLTRGNIGVNVLSYEPHMGMAQVNLEFFGTLGLGDDYRYRVNISI